MKHLALALLLLVPAAARADVATVVTDHVRPGYAAFATATASLAALDSCAPEVLRPAYQTAFDAWMGVSHLHLGPGEEQGRSLAIAFWPDPKSLGAKAQRTLMLGDAAALEPDAFAQQSVAARGLFALERLLYPTDAPPADPCPLIKATTHDLARLADEINAGWGPYGETLVTAGAPGNTTYLTKGEAAQELFTQLATGLEFTADERLGRPLGTFEKPYPTRAEARASGRSLRNVALSLAALRQMAVALEPDIPLTLAAFDRAEGLAAKLDDPALAGVAEPQGRLKVEILQQAIWATRDAVIAEFGAKLKVELGFNSQDGD